MSLIADVAQHIHNQGIASLGTNLFIGYLPSDPDICMAVLDTGGMEPDLELPISNPTFQVFIRTTSYSAGRTKLDQVKDVLHQITNQKLIQNGDYYYYIFAISEGGHVGRDDNSRDTFSINFRVKRRDSE